MRENIKRKAAGACSLLLTMLLAAGCDAPVSARQYEVSSLRWSDGDSGTFMLNGEELRFRLADVDAPETGPVNSETGADCEGERKRGRAAKDYMIRETRGAEISVIIVEDADRYGRVVVHIMVDGESLAERAVKAGRLKHWPHVNGRAMTAKPDWCAD